MKHRLFDSDKLREVALRYGKTRVCLACGFPRAPAEDGAEGCSGAESEATRVFEALCIPFRFSRFCISGSIHLDGTPGLWFAWRAGGDDKTLVEGTYRHVWNWVCRADETLDREEAMVCKALGGPVTGNGISEAFCAVCYNPLSYHEPR